MSLRLVRTANVENRSGSIFGPGGAADGVEFAFDGMRHGVVGDAEHALDALDGGFERGASAQADKEAVAGLLDALDGDSAAATGAAP